MSLALLALFSAAFAIGTSEFVIAGILPAVTTDLGISIPVAGYLVSLYALGVAIGGPVLATFTGRFSRKRLVLLYVAIFTVGYVFCALAPNYPLLLTARFLIALIHGAYFGTAMIIASDVVEEKRRGVAIALILAGLTVANVIGVPIGTAIGNAFGWRMTFWAVAAAGVLSLALIGLLVPADKPREAQQGSLLAEIKVLGREPVYSSLAMIVIQTIGQFALFTYIAPLLTGTTGIGIDAVPWLLLLIGIGSTIGILAGGRLADWRLMPSLTGILALQVVIYLLMIPFAGSPWAFSVILFVWGASVFGFGSPIQARILGNTRDAPLLAASLIPSAFNVSIALGAWLGGTAIDRGMSYAALPWIGVAAAVVATAISFASWMREQRRAA